MPAKFYWYVKTKIDLIGEKFFKDVLNLKEKHKIKINLFTDCKRIVDAMNDFYKISFLKDKIFSGKIIVSLCSKSGTRISEFAHYYKKLPFSETQ